MSDRAAGGGIGTGLACLILLAGLGLGACSNDLSYAPAVHMLERNGRVPPLPGHFAYCYGHGCRTVVDDAQLGADWAAIAALFEPAAVTAAQERRQIAEAVARYEQSLGARYGTAADKGGTFTSFGSVGQLDCIDEALNTTSLLRMLENKGLLVWHDVSHPIQRGYVVDRWPHVTAVVVERRTEKAYAIDSWFRDNGQRADVVPVEAWLDGWVPG